MIRSFIAIPLPEDAARQVVGVQSPIAGARAVPEDDLHLTLAFLGDQPDARLRDLDDELATLAPVPFEITLGPASILGGSAPRAITLDADASDPLVALHRKLARTLRDAGVILERRRFRPHVTLYRVPRSAGPDTDAAIRAWLARRAGAASIRFLATEFRLFQSRLTQDGPVYTSLAEYPFQGIFASAADHWGG